MKKFIFLISTILFFYSCDSSSSSSGPAATPVTVVSLSMSDLDVDFATNTDKQDAFVADLANELGITDLNRVQILSITTPTRASFVIELLFLEATTTSGPSVTDLLNSITDLEQIGDYIIEELETSLSDNMASAEYLLEAANTALENILSDMYTCDDGEASDQICDFDSNDFTPAYDLYMEVLNYDSNHPGANFGAGLTEMLTITQDPLLEEIIEKWDEWDGNGGGIFPSTTVSRSGSSGGRHRKVNVASFNSGIPMGLDAFLMPKNIDFTSFLPLEYLFNYYVSQQSLNNQSGLNRNSETTMMSDFMDIIDNVFLERLTNSITHLEKVVDKDYAFTITPEMQGNSNQQLLTMDDTEFHLLMASMHAIRFMLYSISAVDLDPGINPDEDPQDFEFLEKNSDFLTLRDGKENYFPNAHAEITALLTSLTAAYDFLSDDLDTNNDITLWSDVNGEDIEIDGDDVDLYTFISPVEGGTIFDIFNTNQTIEWCIENCDQECNDAYVNTYDSWYNDYNYSCTCYTSSGSEMIYNVYDDCENINLSLKNFMTNPPNNLKDILPDYSVTTVTDYDFDPFENEWEDTNVILDLSECSYIDCNMVNGNCDDTYYTNYYISGNSSYNNPSAGWSSNNSGSQYLTQCAPVEAYIQQIHDNLNNMIFVDSSVLSDVDEWYSYSANDIDWDGAMSVHLVEDLGNGNYRVSIQLNYYGAWIDEDVEPCIEWTTSNFTTWKSQWDITLGGLFPNMQNGFFFDTFLSVDDDDILDDCSE